jgi:hypothetical protein
MLVAWPVWIVVIEIALQQVAMPEVDDTFNNVN